MDVSNVSPLWKLWEEVYVQLPQGNSDPHNRVAPNSEPALDGAKLIYASH